MLIPRKDVRIYRKIEDGKLAAVIVVDGVHEDRVPVIEQRIKNRLKQLELYIISTKVSCVLRRCKIRIYVVNKKKAMEMIGISQS